MSVRREYDNRGYALANTGVVRAVHIDAVTTGSSEVIGYVENPEEREAKILLCVLSNDGEGGNNKISVGLSDDATSKGDDLIGEEDTTTAGTTYTRDKDTGEALTLKAKGDSSDSFITVHDGEGEDTGEKIGVTVLLAYDY